MSNDPVAEAEANHFAMCLLMPERFVRAEVRKLGGVDFVGGANEKALRSLAIKFGVSVELMTVRICQLKSRSML